MAILLHVEEVRDVAVGVRLVRGPVELEVDHVEPGLLRLEGELGLEGEAQAVGRGLDRACSRPSSRRRRPRGSAGESVGSPPEYCTTICRRGLNEIESSRIFLHLVERQLVDVADLVRVHEAGVAHHVAAVGEVHGQHRAAAVADGRGAVAVDERVPERAEVASRVAALDDVVEVDVDRAQVVEGPVVGAGLGDPELAALLVEGGPDLAEVAVHEVGEVALPAQDPLPGLDHAAGAQRVGLAGVAERRAGPLVGLRQRARAPTSGSRGAPRPRGCSRTGRPARRARRPAAASASSVSSCARAVPARGTRLVHEPDAPDVPPGRRG